MSERQLRRVVRAAFGMSPNRWLKRERIGAVLQLLVDAESVKQVALALGYREMSQFSRDFRNQFGCTPSSVQRQPEKLDALAARLWTSNGRF
jgi:AraC-like DNA-binding protein